MTAAEVSKKIENALQYCGCGAEVAFYGGSFTAISHERQTALLESVQPFLADGRVCSVRISTRPDCIDEKVLTFLQHYHVKTIELGAQSMCDDVLARSERGHTAQSIRDASRLIKAFGFELGLQVMTGLPGDSREKTLYTAQETAALHPDFVRIYPVAVIAGTKLEQMWKNGIYEPLTVSQAADLAGDMLEVFLDASISVIRIGLNPTEELSGEVSAGAYHPALGEMARSRIYRKHAEQAMQGMVFDGNDAVLRVACGAVSLMTGVKRENMIYLTEKLQTTCRFRRIVVREDALLPRYEVKCSCNV